MLYKILGIVVMVIIAVGGTYLITTLGHVTDTTDQTLIGVFCGFFGGLVGSTVWGMSDK